MLYADVAIALMIIYSRYQQNTIATAERSVLKLKSIKNYLQQGGPLLRVNICCCYLETFVILKRTILCLKSSTV